MSDPKFSKQLQYLYIAFFISGFAAILYQLAWQRSLFRIYGINTESVAIIVASFMLGLGLGSFCGGWLSSFIQNHLSLIVFAAFEAGIAAFGLFSLALFDWIGEKTLLLGWPQIALATFLLVLIPTMLMGATLPILVSYFSRQWKNVELSISKLYFINTLGSAFGAYVCVIWFYKYLGLSRTTFLAVGFNLLTVLMILYCQFKTKNAG